MIDFTYDTMNRLTSTTLGGQVTTYYYDNAGNRFIKKSSSGTTVYLRHGQIAVALDIELYNNETEHNGTINRYVLSGDLLAGHITTKYLNKTLVSTEKFWYHLDHLNSTKCVTAQDGSLNVMYEYRAFGEQLKKLGEGEAKYTYGGKELDDATNLYYFNARYYDATIGRFINVDPIQDGTNWYVYCNNNPLSFVDPTGLEDEKIIETKKQTDANTETKDWFEESQNDISDALDGNLDGKMDADWGWALGSYKDKEGNEHQYKYSSLCLATSLMESQDKNSGHDVDLQTKVDFLKANKDKLFNDRYEITDALKFTQDYASFVKEKYKLNKIASPVGYVKDGDISGSTTQYGIGKSVSNRHFVTFDNKNYKVDTNPWAKENSNWSKNDAYGLIFLFKY